MAWVEFAAKKDSSIGLSCSFQVAFLFQLFSSFKSAILIFLVDCLTSSQIPYFFMCRLQISVYRIVPSPLFFTLLVFSASASNAEFCILHSAFGIWHSAFWVSSTRKERWMICVYGNGQEMTTPTAKEQGTRTDSELTDLEDATISINATHRFLISISIERDHSEELSPP